MGPTKVQSQTPLCSSACVLKFAPRSWQIRWPLSSLCYSNAYRNLNSSNVQCVLRCINHGNKLFPKERERERERERAGIYLTAFEVNETSFRYFLPKIKYYLILACIYSPFDHRLLHYPLMVKVHLANT